HRVVHLADGGEVHRSGDRAGRGVVDVAAPVGGAGPLRAADPMCDVLAHGSRPSVAVCSSEASLVTLSSLLVMTRPLNCHCVGAEHFVITELACRPPGQLSKPSPNRSSVRSQRLRRPSRRSARSSDQRVRFTPMDFTGSGGNGSGFVRTSSSSVSSVGCLVRRSSITFAPKRVAPTPSPVYPAA